MPYPIRTFPLTAAIWRAGMPVAGPPAVVTPCNVAFGRRVHVVFDSTGLEAGALLALLLFPAGTDVRDNVMAPGADVVECPQGSGRVYGGLYVNDLGSGFSNEHRFAGCEKLAPWPAPLPPVFEAPPA